MAVRGAQGGVLHLCTGVRVGGHHKARLAQLDVVEVQQVAVVGRDLHHIVDCAHRRQTACHDAQTDEGDEGAAQKPQDRVAALFLRLPRRTAAAGRLLGGASLPESTVAADLSSFVV